MNLLNLLPPELKQHVYEFSFNMKSYDNCMDELKYYADELENILD